jgi:hypothetical protein
MADTDERDLQRLAKTTGQRVRDIPRIASVYWVDNRLFLVKPMACIPRPTSSRAGTFELFDTDGKSKGRAILDCDYDPEQDAFFLRHGMLVIIEGGKAAVDAAIRQKAAMIGKSVDRSSPDSVSDVIHIRAYGLVSYCRR